MKPYKLIILGILFVIPQFALAEEAKVSYDGKTEFIERDSSFNEKPPIFTDEIKTKLINADWVLGDAYNEPILTETTSANEVKIMGEAEATKEQMLKLLLKRNENPKLTCSAKELVDLYYAEGEREGIRPDIALSQAYKETGYFKYGGDVLPEQNNYCGLGAVGGGAKGAKFATPELGVRAHIQHIKAYASKDLPKNPIVDPRYEHIRINRPDIFGNIKNWTGLNGRWAVPGTRYGQDILKITRYALSIPDEHNKLKENIEDNNAYIYRGIVSFYENNFSQAEKDFSNSLKLKETWEGYYDRAMVYEKMAKQDKAAKDYAKAVEISPSEVEIWYNLGLIRFKQKKYREAIEDFTKVLNLNPHMTNAAIAKAVSHVKLKEFDEAWADFYKANQINTNDKIIKADRVILENIIR